MSLRYRLFLWVSGLFLVIAVSSLFIESYATHQQLKKAQSVLREKLLTLSEERRKDLENFLASAIAERQVTIDAILNNLSLFTPQILRFGPTEKNIVSGTWKAASELLMDFRWIDFLMSSNQSNVSSEIIPEANTVNSTYRIPIEKGISWVYMRNSSDPYIGVEIPFKYLGQQVPVGKDQVIKQGLQFEPYVHLLFDLKKIKEKPLSLFDQQNTSSIPVAWSEGFELQIAPFIQFFQRMNALSTQGKLVLPHLSSGDLQEKFGESLEGIINMIPGGILLSTAQTEKYMHERLEATSLRSLQVNLIWVLIAMYETGLFGKDLFSFPMPEGISLFSNEEDVGVGLKTTEVLFSKKSFNDALYYAQNTPFNHNSMLGTSLALITEAKPEHLYLGNTVEFEINSSSDMKKGYLTLGVDADGILQKLVLALRQSVFLVNNQKIITGFDSEGEKMAVSEGKDLPLETMLQEKYGLISWQGKNYFFLHMKPFSSVDLHFFLLNPEEIEFAILRDLEEGSEQVVKTILFNLHATGVVALLIAVIVLHNISRNITKPIVQLASATKEIKEGHYEQIQFPVFHHEDEIAVLCRSFEEMVKGLIEKEKVKGVLNKVVSQEIAQEILKGNVHLGGEVKRVSVLFADIRGFTQMTQHMSPEDVIELLNTCMTKISVPIDAHHGVIDKYVGDEAMALFGAPIEIQESALNAIEAALEMVEVLKKWNLERSANNEPPIEMGISIHTGEMLAGNMGAENRLNYTVLGSNVNLAARLCDTAKRMQILITKQTLEEPYVKEKILYEPLSSMQFKGFDASIEVFQVTGKKA